MTDPDRTVKDVSSTAAGMLTAATQAAAALGDAEVEPGMTAQEVLADPSARSSSTLKFLYLKLQLWLLGLCGLGKGAWLMGDKGPTKIR